MNCKAGLSNSIILLVFVVCMLQQGRAFDSNLLRFVDQKNQHYIVTGGPIVTDSQKFPYHRLKEQLEIFTKSNDTRIVSISLLGLPCPYQTKQRYMQENFYNTIPGRVNQAVVDRTPSYYYNFGIGGAWFSPSSVPGFLLGKFKKYYKYLADDPSQIQQIFQIINKQLSYNLKSIIYIHNIDGYDQVSEILGVYKMKYLQKQLKDVLIEINEFYRQRNQSGGIGRKFRNALEWYCLGLGRSEEKCLVGGVGDL